MFRFALLLACLASPALGQTLFTSTAAAQAHCPADTIVWLNTVNHSYRLPGQKGYGRAHHSSYACRRDADAAGDHAKKPKAPKSKPAPASQP